MARVVWKGAISFGLVHVPVALYPASQEVGVDFDWLDKRSMDPVGYKRVNKRTGKEIAREDIVKAVKLEDGEALVKHKVDAGKTERVVPLEGAPEAGSWSNVVDLTELLAQSLAKRKPATGKLEAKTALSLKAPTPKRAVRKRA